MADQRARVLIMNEKLIAGYQTFVSTDEFAGAAASVDTPAISPTPATPISTLSVASFTSGATTYTIGC
ncbi:hypothetical protein SAMN04488550_4453 [Gordonia malaquae]|jgi:hypothetical protein|uniref:LxmA leader domain family RiPP n=2 Tax=Gordoniaceae TaxID=85026 RepID=UPI00089AD5E2|nr:LxmA leader domain family RiPP [Gordonia malaquae]SEE39316.1 hypothetical protein SAMN04488550_4453 [Gordonia malaquae]